ncbi:MAG: recombinase family protein [Lachnoclostridium sp.]|nr:recombinase family protein [Lachnoclostridium sp.]
MTPDNNAVCYARYSSHGQNEQSPEQQFKVCEEYAARCGYNIIDYYQEMITSSLIQSHYKGAKTKTPKDHFFQAFFSIHSI